MTATDQSVVEQVVAIEEVAERILQTTAEDMARLHNMGEKLELDSIKVTFQGKTYLMMLRRTFGKNAENQRRLLLLSYYEDPTSTTKALPYTRSQSAGTSNSDCGSSNQEKGVDISLSGSSNQEKGVDISLSPIKRQMSEIAITSEQGLQQLVPTRDLLQGSYQCVS
ncbi:hypothetical protein LIER_09539 [Lithospermum erythrorhizon]|uniref:Uncharacterized protein n=1 Tax=Lithospermum erythrorhizon TaxID=34254 RepID=A0AAV3PH85_LITER